MAAARPCVRARARRYGSLLTVTALVLASSSAHAGPQDPAALERLYKEGRTAVLEQYLEDALGKFQQLYAATGSPLDACHVGLVAYQLSRLPEAFEHLSICTEHTLTPSEEASKKMILERAKNALEDTR